MKIWFVMTVVALLANLGCRERRLDAEAEMYEKAEQGIREHREAVLNNGSAGVCATSLVAQLRQIPSREKRQEFADAWLQSLCAIRLTEIPVDQDAAFGACLSEVWDAILKLEHSGLIPTERGRWRIHLRYLSWLREQTKSLSRSLTYPPEVQRVEGLNGSFHWSLRREDGQKLREYMSRLGRYNECALSFETKVGWCERRLQEDLRVGKAEVREVVEDVEKFLGRRLRTRAECEADDKIERRIEFPRLVPMPDGVRPQWSGR